MALKHVEISTQMGDGTKIECQAGKHSFLIDQNKAGGGEDLGPSPLECYLASIAGCIASIGRIVARQKHITLRGMKIKTVGDLNTDVLLGRNTTERAGFQNIRVEVALDADLSQEQKVEFLDEVERRCPVSENTRHESAIAVSVVPT